MDALGYTFILIGGLLLGGLFGFCLGCMWLQKQKEDQKREPSLKEIQNTLTYINNNFLTDKKTFKKVHKEFMSENEKCYNCSSTTRMYCIKRPHSEDCNGPYDW